jgi:hypothetical protein
MHLARVFVTLGGVLCIAMAGMGAQGSETVCAPPQDQPCTVRHGRFSTQNGITQTIWLIGTRRIVNVANDLKDFLPRDVLKYTEMTSPDHGDIFGDFTVCPLEPETAGHMRAVCVAAAKHLVVQPDDKSRRPVRIGSTWTLPPP